MANGYQPGVYRPDGNKLVVVDGVGVVQFGDTVATSGLSMGGGSTAYPLSTAAAGSKFLSFYTKSTDATGADSRALYMRHAHTGAGASTDAVRAFVVLTGAGAVAARGAMFSLVAGGAGGTVTGEGCGIKGQLEFINTAGTVGTGTYAAVQAEVYLDGTDSDVSAATSVALFRGVVAGAGGATQNAKVKYAFAFDGISNATGAMCHTGQGDRTSDAVLQITINGSPFMVLLKSGTTV